MNPHDLDLIAALNKLIEVCKDGEEGFRNAASCVSDSDLKVLFTSYGEQRAEFASELQAEVMRLGGDPPQRGSLAGVLHRGWTNLKSMVASGDDAPVVAECERGEEMAKNAYEDALRQSLPTDVHAVLNRQMAGVKEALNRVRALEAAATA